MNMHPKIRLLIMLPVVKTNFASEGSLISPPLGTGGIDLQRMRNLIHCRSKASERDPGSTTNYDVPPERTGIASG